MTLMCSVYLYVNVIIELKQIPLPNIFYLIEQFSGISLRKIVTVGVMLALHSPYDKNRLIDKTYV